MSVHLVEGDLFKNRHGAQALAHGCNCQGVMGAGIAVGFKERYPAMFAEYRRRCLAKPRLFNPGDVLLWREPGSPAVFNLATQEHYRRGARATLPAVEACLRRMRELADDERIASVAMPRIGAGLGGLDWGEVLGEIRSAFAGWAGELWVYETFSVEP